MSQNESTDPRNDDSTQHDEHAETEASDAGAETGAVDSGEAESAAEADSGHDTGDEAARLREAMLRLRAEMDNREKRI